MEYKVLGNIGTVVVKHLDILNVIGKNYLNPVSLVRLRRLEAPLSKAILADKQPDLFENAIYVMRWQQMDFTPHFRNLNRQFQESCEVASRFAHIDVLNRRIELKHATHRIGNTSATNGCVITDEDAGEILARAKSICVLFDPGTGKPAHFPDTVKEYINAQTESSAYVMPVGPFFGTEFCPVPDETKTHSVFSSITAQDIDDYVHTNQSHYLDLCINCIAQWIPHGVFPNMTEYLWKYDLRRCSLLYMEQSRIGDEIETLMWQDRENEWVFHFHTKNKEKVINQGELEFFDPNESLQEIDLFLI